MKVFKSDYFYLLIGILSYAVISLGFAYMCAHTPLGGIVDAIVGE